MKCCVVKVRDEGDVLVVRMRGEGDVLCGEGRHCTCSDFLVTFVGIVP